MKSSSVLIVLAAAALLALRGAQAAAYEPPPSPLPLLPLEVGNHWEYQGAAGGSAAEVITGTLTMLGRTVAVKHYVSGPDAGLDNWWLTGPNGEVMLAGFDRAADSFSLAYEPPITLCGGAPAPGDSWTTHVVAYTLPGLAVYAEFDLTYALLEDVSLGVPAGTFHAFGVGQLFAGAPPALAASRGFGPDGRRVSGALQAVAGDPTDWFSPGVGLVQYRASGLFQLSGYGIPTPARALTWGGLKQLYR